MKSIRSSEVSSDAGMGDPLIRPEVETAVADLLRPLVAALFLLYLFFAGSHQFFLPPPAARLLTIVALATAVFMASVWFALRRGRIAGSWLHGLATAVGASVVGNVLIHMALTRDIAQTSLLMLVLFGSGIVLVSHAWYAAFLLGSIGAWLVVVVGAEPQELFAHYAFGILAAATGSVAVHSAWAGSVGRIASLRRSELRRQEATLDAVGRLAGGVAHDFNNLLTAITGYADLLDARLDPDDPLHADLREIQRAAAHGRELTGRLLAVGRKQTLSPRRLDVNRFISEALADLRESVSEDVRLKLALSPDLPAIEMDPNGFREVLLSLVLNAPSAVRRGGAITIATAVAEADEAAASLRPGVLPGTYVRVTVRDRYGLADRDVERAFEPFFDPASPLPGSGLGLSMTYGLVRQSAGFAYAEREGSGCAFHVCLPLANGHPRAAGLQDPPARPRSDSFRGEETILVVEDEDVVRKLAQRVLGQMGYTVVAASDGAEAVSLAENWDGPPFDLVLSDVVMPGMSGSEVVRELESRISPFKVLYMSGYAADDVVHHGVEAETVEFLQKPFTPGALGRKVREVLDA